MNLAIKVIGRLLIVAYGITDPTEPEWLDYLKLVAQLGVDGMQRLIYTAGGAPSLDQFKSLAALLDGRVVPTAVVPHGLRVCAGVAAMSWFTSSVRTFPPGGLEDAFAFLNIRGDRQGTTEQELTRLRRAIGEL